MKMLASESLIYGAIFGLSSFSICLITARSYFRELKPSLVLSSIYGLIALILVSIYRGQPEKGPDLGMTAGIMMLLFMGFIYIMLQILGKSHRDKKCRQMRTEALLIAHAREKTYKNFNSSYKWSETDVTS